MMDWQEVIIWCVCAFTWIVLIAGMIVTLLMVLWFIWCLVPPFHRDMMLRDLEKRLDRMEEEEKEKALD